MQETKIIKCGFGVRRTFDGQKDFDVDYKEIEVVNEVVPLDAEKTKFSIAQKEIVHKRPIRETIQAQVDQVGIEAYMKPYELAGVGLPDVEVSQEIQDFSNLPDVDDVSKVGDAALKAFNALDPALRGNAKTIEEFLKGMTQEKFDAYIASKIKKVEVKEKADEK